MNGEDFTKKEQEEALKNGFLLAGKTGAGKSTLLNVLLNKEIAKVKRSSKAVTSKVAFYYYKLQKNNKMITIIDSPGLEDTNKIIDKNIDNVHLDEIKNVVSQNHIQLKGILFLVNFQNERFDSSESNALINYNKIFPLPKFWEYILIIFTHYFGDPDGETVDEMKEERDSSNGEIFSNIMKYVEEVSEVIDYPKLKTKFLNSYCPAPKERQKIKNEKNRKELEDSLNEFCEKQPLISKIEILTIKNYGFEENGKNYKADLIKIGYFGLGKEPIKEENLYTNKEEVKKKDINKLNQEVSVQMFDAKRNEDGKIEKSQKEDKEGNSYYMEKLKTTGLGTLIGTGSGLVLGGIGGALLFTPLAPAALAAFSFGGILAGGVVGGGILGTVGGFIKSIFKKKNK